MVDIVIPLNKSSRWQDNELKYALRSVEKFLRNHGRVFIVGDLPKWTIQNVIHIPAHDTKYPAKSIMQKVLLACKDERVSDTFLFMNDDHFITTPMDADTFPYFHKGPLANSLKNRTDYLYTVKNTLMRIGGDAKDFDIHTPIRYDKNAFIDTMTHFDWEVPHGYCIKSIYCATTGITGQQLDEGKFYQSKSMEQLQHWFSSHPIVSVGDECLGHFVKEYLDILFQTKSKYEL